MTTLLSRRYLSTRTMSTLTARPPNWKAVAPAPLPGTTTFAAQASLPKLPVPELHVTLTRLKEALKPLVKGEAEYTTAVTKIDEFGQGKGKELQNRLLKRHAQTNHWLEEWWDDLSYLGYRDSVVVNVTYYYGFDRPPAHLPQTAPARAAGLARTAMIFRQKLKQGLIEPDGTKEGPHCMDSYRWMFDCCRVPGPQGLDWSITYAKESDLGDSGHIIVFRKNRLWKVDTTKDGNILSLEDFEKQFQHIYHSTTQEYPGVGVLPANNRDVWAKDYAELVSDAHNKAILKEIHSAAFSISLDSETPSNPIAHSRDLWHGGVTNSVPSGLRNRWVDKPVQFIVFDNAEAGIMGEHSVMDGTPIARMCDEVLDILYDPVFDKGQPSSTPFTAPTPLDWKITPATNEALKAADQAAMDLISSQQLSFHETAYGKAAIKRFGVSPDSWAQMIIQLAYRRLVGDKRNGGTYEAATTRKFYKGRTETIKVVTSESDAWVKSMDNPDVDQTERKRLFDEAAKKHIQLAKNGGNGQGVDRHMLGLKLSVQKGEDVPAVFSDPLVVRASYWVLSTSAIFSKHFSVYGWGEVVPDGFGIAYVTGHDDRLQYTITSRKEMPNAQFRDQIAKAAVDLYDLHLSVTKSKL